jgi:hypothetical protein
MKISIHQRFSLLLILTSICWIKPVIAQDANLMKQLQQSNYLHYTMKADSTNAGITRWLSKTVEKSRILPLAAEFNSVRIKGPGNIKIDHAKTISGDGSILLETPTSLGEKNPTNRSYAFAELIRPLKGEDLSDYNRFSVWVYADAPGFFSSGLFSLEPSPRLNANSIASLR